MLDMVDERGGGEKEVGIKELMRVGLQLLSLLTSPSLEIHVRGTGVEHEFDADE